MPRKASVNTNFSNDSDDAFYRIAMIIFNALILNIGLFPGLPVIMGVLGPIPAGSLGAAIKVYNDTRLMTPYLGQAADVASARLAVQRILTENGAWLNIFCVGVETLLIKTGYPLAKEAEAQGKLEQTEITLIPVLGGMDFMISHIPAKGVRFGVMFTLESNLERDPSKWDKFYYAGSRDGNIPNLLSDVKYKFSSFGMGTSLDLTYSNIMVAKPL